MVFLHVGKPNRGFIYWSLFLSLVQRRDHEKRQGENREVQQPRQAHTRGMPWGGGGLFEAAIAPCESFWVHPFCEQCYQYSAERQHAYCINPSKRHAGTVEPLYMSRGAFKPSSCGIMRRGGFSYLVAGFQRQSMANALQLLHSQCFNTGAKYSIQRIKLHSLHTVDNFTDEANARIRDLEDAFSIRCRSDQCTRIQLK